MKNVFMLLKRVSLVDVTVRVQPGQTRLDLLRHQQLNSRLPVCCSSASQVEELETSVRKLMREKEELHQALEEQEEQTSITLQEESHRLRVQNQELQHKVPDSSR